MGKGGDSTFSMNLANIINMPVCIFALLSSIKQAFELSDAIIDACQLITHTFSPIRYLLANNKNGFGLEQ